MDRAPDRTGVVKVVSAIEIGYVRRPKISGETRDVVRRPGRRTIGKHGAGRTPVPQVRGLYAGYSLTITVDEVICAVFDHGSRVMQKVIAIKGQFDRQ